MDNCFCCDGKSFVTIPYNNHLSDPKRSIKQSIIRILYLIIPKSFLYRFNNRLSKQALLGLWAKNKITVCDNCGAGKIKNIPSKQEIDHWFNTKGSVVKKDADINFNKGSIRSKSQFEYMAQYIKMDKLRNSLEFGSGIAYLSKTIKKEVEEIITMIVEISDQTIRFLKNVDYVDEVYDNLFDIKDQPDVIFCSHILPFLAPFQNVWSDLIGKLNKGGYIFIEQWNYNKDYYMLDHLDCPVLYFFSSKSLTELSSNFGLKIIDISCWGYSWTDFVLHKKGKMYFENNNGIFLRAILQKT